MEAVEVFATTPDEYPPDYFSASDIRRRPRTFRVEDCDQVRAEPGEWIVKSLLPKVGLCIVFGQSGCGKSFVCVDWCSSLARGLPVLGLRSSRCGVVYIAAEGANGLRKRFEGLRNAVGPWDGRILLIGDAPNLGSTDDVADLRSQLLDIKADMTRRGVRLGLVVVDTLSASIPGVDENSAKEVSPVLTGLQQIAVDAALCVLVIAHSGKDGARGIRGWSGLHANADGVINVAMPNGDGPRTLEVTKVKDGETGGRHAFELCKVSLGTDDDGDQVTTCIVEWLGEAPSEQTRRADRMRPPMVIIQRALGRCIDDGYGKAVAAPGARPGTHGVELGRLRDMAFSLGLGGVEPGDEGDAQRRWRDTRRKAFNNNLAYLQRDGRIRVENGLAWSLD